MGRTRPAVPSRRWTSPHSRGLRTSSFDPGPAHTRLPLPPMAYRHRRIGHRADRRSPAPWGSRRMFPERQFRKGSFRVRTSCRPTPARCCRSAIASMRLRPTRWRATACRTRCSAHCRPTSHDSVVRRWAYRPRVMPRRLQSLQATALLRALRPAASRVSTSWIRSSSRAATSRRRPRNPMVRRSPSQRGKQASTCMPCGAIFRSCRNASTASSWCGWTTRPPRTSRAR